MKKKKIIEEDGFDPELEECDYPLAISRERVEKKWQEILENNLQQSLKKYETLASIHNWVLPDSSIFFEYFEVLEKEVRSKYKKGEEITVQKYDDHFERYFTHSVNRVEKELYPFVHELLDNCTFHLPEPMIPESFLLDWMASEKQKLVKRNLIPSHPNLSFALHKPAPSTSSPSQKKPEPPKTLRVSLKSLFEEKYGNTIEWQKLLKTLKQQEKLDPDSCIWQKHKNELAGTIRVIEKRHLNLTTSLTLKEVVEIAKNDFKSQLTIENCRGETFERWNTLEI